MIDDIPPSSPLPFFSMAFLLPGVALRETGNLLVNGDWGLGSMLAK